MFGARDITGQDQAARQGNGQQGNHDVGLLEVKESSWHLICDTWASFYRDLAPKSPFCSITRRTGSTPRLKSRSRRITHGWVPFPFVHVHRPGTEPGHAAGWLVASGSLQILLFFADFAENEKLCRWIADTIPTVVQPETWANSVPQGKCGTLCYNVRPARHGDSPQIMRPMRKWKRFCKTFSKPGPGRTKAANPANPP